MSKKKKKKRKPEQPKQRNHIVMGAAEAMSTTKLYDKDGNLAYAGELVPDSEDAMSLPSTAPLHEWKAALEDRRNIPIIEDFGVATGEDYHGE